MSETLRTRLSVLITLLLLGFVVVGLVTADPPEVDRAREIGSIIRCPVCNGESIADSPSAYARDMMTVVNEGIDAGLSDDQIIDGLLVAYTDSQRLDPSLSPETVALWAVPTLVLLIGIALATGERRSARVRTTEPQDAVSDR